MWKIFAAIIRPLLHPRFAHGYRPERHYMRGPGPKGRAV